MPSRSCCRPGTRWAPWPGSRASPDDQPEPPRAALTSHQLVLLAVARNARAAEGVVVIGHLRDRAETREAGPAEAPATVIHLTVDPAHVITQRRMKPPQAAQSSPDNHAGSLTRRRLKPVTAR